MREKELRISSVVRENYWAITSNINIENATTKSL
jgi:hypothetical protein